MQRCNVSMWSSLVFDAPGGKTLKSQSDSGDKLLKYNIWEMSYALN